METGNVTKLPILYKYGLYNPLTWTISYLYNGVCGIINTSYGQLNGKQTNIQKEVYGVNIGRANETSPLEQAKKEAEAEWLLKLKQGYKERLEDISPLITDINEILKPMKAQKDFSKEKLTKKIGFPCIQQPKLNGLRAVLRWEDDYTIGEDMFKQTCPSAILRSKEGIEYFMPHITESLREDYFINRNTGDRIAYDGELYSHELKLNQIKASCPFKIDGKINKCSLNPTKVKFYTFDLSVPNIIQKDRDILLFNNVMDYTYHQSGNIIYLDHNVCMSYEDAIIWNEKYLKIGYEGSIFRNMEAMYNFGGRPSTMLKLKHKKNTECIINDIILKEDTGNRSYICFVLH
ncbi:MAG: hypothetical protein WC917_03575, partial [Bacilli bacterium]